MKRFPAVALCALAACACAPRLRDGLSTTPPRALDHAREARTVAVAGASVRIQYLREDEEDARDVAEVLLAAIPRAQTWGALRVPVTITLHPDHESFEAAAHRPGYGWLRAWARFASIDLQSPRTWSARSWWPWAWLFRGSRRQELQELLAHELTHCAMYQAAGSEWSWQYLGIPAWFREGMASVTAGQGHGRDRPGPIRDFYALAARERRGTSPRPTEGDGGGAGRPARGDPLSDPDPLYRSRAEVVYGAAHLSFQFLVARYGEVRVRRVLENMSEGHLFPAAFEEAIGIPAAAFEADFRRYILWGGWRPAGD